MLLRFFQTIVATALPTIVEELGDGNNYSWVGRSVRGSLPIPLTLMRHNSSSYLLAAATLSPLYGKLSDLIGQPVPPKVLPRCSCRLQAVNPFCTLPF